MNQLNDKLDEILDRFGPQDDFAGVFTEETREKIKEAFIDDGWRRVTNTELKNIAKAHLIDEACMTGEEWYKKFEKELVGKPFYITGPGDVYVIHAVQQCLRIAQRVSGVPIEPADFDWSERQKKRFKENKEKLSDWALPAIRPEVWWDEY